MIRLFFICIVLFQFLLGVEKREIRELAASLAHPLFELSNNEANTILEAFMNDNIDVQYIIVKDTIVNEEFAVYYRDQYNTIRLRQSDDETLPNNCQRKKVSNIELKGEDIGDIYLCLKEIIPELQFTKEEEAWIKSHPIITVHNERDWAPFNFNKNGEPMGYSIDYIRLLAQKSGLKVKFQTANWNKLLNKAYTNELDVMMNIARTSEREKKLLYVGVYARNVAGILTQENRTDISNLESLFGKKVSVVKGFIYEEFLEKRYPKIEVVKYNDAMSALKAVVFGDVDATLGKTAVFNYLISENLIKGLKYTADVKADDPEMENLYIAVRKEAPLLQSILKKTMNHVSIKEVDELRLKWFKQRKRVHFTNAEYAWLDRRPIVRYSEVNWKPLSIIDNNAMSGIMGDYLNMVADLTGIEFEFVPSKSWPDVLEKFKKGEIDLVPGVSNTKEEMELGLITRSFATYPMVIVTNENIEYVNSMDSIKNNIFALPKHYSSYNYVKSLYPKAKILETKNVPEALLNVSNEKADVFVGHIAPAVYNIAKIGKDNLKISGDAGQDFSHHFLIQSSLPQLHSIVNKVFESITEKERERIYNGWLDIKVEQNTGFSLQRIITYIIPVVLVIAVILALIVYWNRKLKSLVDKKTQNIQEQKEELQTLLDSFDRNVIFVQTDLQGVITHPSRAFCEVCGYQEKELIGKSTNILRHPDMPKELFEKLWNTIKSKMQWRGEIKNRAKDGSDYWVYSRIEPEYNNDGEQIGYKSISQDITNKKIVEDLSINLEKKVEERTLDLENAKKKIEALHQNTQDSIEYASLIQHTLIPSSEVFRGFFSDYFAIWQPKDIVGGDVYLFEKLDEDNCLLMVIDCTGHGVPGAFVTMLVKAIERQIISTIISKKEELSPAKILRIFNRSMKHLLKQEDENSISNAGFDGGVLCYNKKKAMLKYAGANIPLFYIKEGKLNIIKADRHSIGYKKSDRNFEFKEHVITTQKGMSFYLSTDGYLDQNGGAKGFPFGKRRFAQLIEEFHSYSCADQQEQFLYTLMEYQGVEERNDDIAVVGVKI